MLYVNYQGCIYVKSALVGVSSHNRSNLLLRILFSSTAKRLGELANIIRVHGGLGDGDKTAQSETRPNFTY